MFNLCIRYPKVKCRQQTTAPRFNIPQRLSSNVTTFNGWDPSSTPYNLVACMPENCFLVTVMIILSRNLINPIMHFVLGHKFIGFYKFHIRGKLQWKLRNIIGLPPINGTKNWTPPRNPRGLALKTKAQRRFPSDKFMGFFSGSRQVNALRVVCR